MALISGLWRKKADVIRAEKILKKLDKLEVGDVFFLYESSAKVIISEISQRSFSDLRGLIKN